MLKLTQEQLAAAGFKTHEELAAALPALFAMRSTVEGIGATIQTAISPVASRVSALEAGATTTTTALAEVRTAVAGIVPEARVKALAREEATTVLGNSALQPGQAAPANPGTAVPDATKAATDKLLAEGKFAEAYAASPKLQAEFSSADRLAAYHRHSGSVRILEK